MNQFEYVMVLVSIIVGLGITHILLGVGGIIDRLASHGRPLKLSLAHGCWLGMCFVWLVMFWWWEYRLASQVSDWNFGYYSFLIAYSVTLFLITVVLVPKSWDRVESLKVYFLERRSWFYSLLLVGTMLDASDAFLTGGIKYILEHVDALVWAVWIATIPAVIVGIKSAKIRVHNVMGVVFLIWQVLLGIQALPILIVR